MSTRSCTCQGSAFKMNVNADDLQSPGIIDVLGSNQQSRAPQSEISYMFLVASI